MRKLWFISAILGFCFFNANAQNGLFSPKNIVNHYSTAGIGGGSSHYFGDLAPYSYFYHGLYTNVRWNITGNYTRFLSQQFGVRAQLSYIRIAGDDYTFGKRNLDNLWRNYIRNMNFRNDIKEFNISGIWNLLPQYNKGPRGRSTIMPFATAGIGFYSHRPEGNYPSNATGAPFEWVDLKTANTSSVNYSLVQVVMPLSLGIRYKLNEKIDITLEGGLRLTPTDYLDDVSQDPYLPAGGNPVLNPTILQLHRSGANRAVELLAIESDPQKIPAAAQNGQASWYTNFVGDEANVAGAITRRGSQRVDTYVVSMFTISYIISNKIQCPIIK